MDFFEQSQNYHLSNVAKGCDWQMGAERDWTIDWEKQPFITLHSPAQEQEVVRALQLNHCVKLNSFLSFSRGWIGIKVRSQDVGSWVLLALRGFTLKFCKCFKGQKARACDWNDYIMYLCTFFRFACLLEHAFVFTPIPITLDWWTST